MSDQASEAMKPGPHINWRPSEHRTPYFPPPENYESPAMEGCAKCGKPITCVPVVGGYGWRHLTGPINDAHEVQMPREWWDTEVGRFRLETTVYTVRGISIMVENMTAYDSIPTVERVYPQTDSGAFQCIYEGCGFARRDAEAVWRHVHTSKKHPISPPVVEALELVNQ